MNFLRKVSNMLNRLHGQPDSYDKKYATPDASPSRSSLMRNGRSRYRFGRTLGAGTYGIVREAEGPDGRVAVKIILKKNVRGNEQMVLDELDLLQRLKHPHIVKFVDWFESRVCTPKLGGPHPPGSRQKANRLAPAAGQVLHRHRACDGRRAVRQNLRAGQVY